MGNSNMTASILWHLNEFKGRYTLAFFEFTTDKEEFRFNDYLSRFCGVRGNLWQQKQRFFHKMREFAPEGTFFTYLISKEGHYATRAKRFVSFFVVAFVAVGAWRSLSVKIQLGQR